MKICCVIIVLLLISSAYGDERLKQFLSWTTQHKKNYNDQKEFLYRFQIWNESMNKIESHNNEEHSYKLAMNQFGDLTHSEFLEYFGSMRYKPVNKSKDRPQPLPDNVPESWDWRDHGAVTPIGNQQQCGSSPYWAAVGAIEGVHVISGQGSLVSLSVQQVVDCSQNPPYNNAGCNGGMMNISLEYVRDNHGIETNVSYPYTAVDGDCAYSASNKAAWIDSYVNVPPNENALLQAILISPVATAVMVTDDFEFYSSGIFNDPTCTDQEIDLGILVIGYGVTRTGEEYWILKNAWGTTWGMEGYLLLERGYDRCGVAELCSYPVIKSKIKM